jgi:hypothetical protein
MKSVLARQPVLEISQEISELVDHRYFYDEYDPKLESHVGHSTCGLSRKAVGTMLLASSNLRFTDKDFLKSLPEYIKNPSVTGFMIEQAVLSSNALNGLNISPETNRSMVVRLFKGQTANLDPDTEDPVLYLPHAFNFKGIDGLIVRRELQPKPGLNKRRLLVLPLQITVARKHKDSYETFFNDWNTWIAGLGGIDVWPQFIWITENGADNKNHTKDTQRQWPAHDELNISLRQVNNSIASMYDDAKRRNVS